MALPVACVGYFGSYCGVSGYDYSYLPGKQVFQASLGTS
jgi:hypothetical protein